MKLDTMMAPYADVSRAWKMYRGWPEFVAARSRGVPEAELRDVFLFGWAACEFWRASASRADEIDATWR